MTTLENWVTLKTKHNIWWYLIKVFPYRWFCNLIENKILTKLVNEKTGKVDYKVSLNSMKWREHWT